MGAPSSPSGDGANANTFTFSTRREPVTALNAAIAGVQTTQAGLTAATQHHSEAAATVMTLLTPLIRHLVLVEESDGTEKFCGFLRRVTSSQIEIFNIDSPGKSPIYRDLGKGMRVRKVTSWEAGGTIVHEPIEGLDTALSLFDSTHEESERASKALQDAKWWQNDVVANLVGQRLHLKKVKTGPGGPFLTVQGTATDYSGDNLYIFDYHTGSAIPVLITDKTEASFIMGITAV